MSMILAEFELGDALLSILFFFLWFLWIFLVITIIIDVFRSHDLSGWAKALWVLFIIMVPLIAVLIYLIARGHTMQQRWQRQAQQQEELFRQQVQAAAGSSSPADELAKLSDLRSQGVISEEEFQQLKAKALS
jgi:ABC-type transport system involved in multi-copper enzyme maturation permease subunit